MKQLNLTFYLFILFLVLFSSCQYRSQRMPMEQFANALVAEQSDSVPIQKELAARQMTDSLDALRGYPLAETKSNSQEIDYNTGVVLVVLLGVLFVGFIIFRLIKGFKNGLKDFSYAAGEIKSKGRELLNDPETVTKMSTKEKEQLDEMMVMFEKKWKK